MDFIGRQAEMDVLENQYRLDHPFVLMYGRRRVGKSTLIKRFISGKTALYYQVDDDLDSTFLPSFGRAVSDALGMSGVSFATWNDAFETYVENTPGRKVIVIDEFQYLMMSDKGTLRRFQSIWDNYLSARDVMLILCGSYLTMMKNISSDYNNPLYQRNTAELHIRPLPFDVVSKGEDHRRDVEEYAITGGVPYYMKLLDPDLEPVRNAANLIIRLGAPLINEPEHLLSREFRSNGSYNGFLRTVAEGNSKSADISSATSLTSSECAPYLDRLQTVGMVRRDVPITEEDPKHSRKGLYRVSDNFMALWYRFAYPYHRDLDAGDYEEAEQNLMEHFVDGHVSYVFEDVCLQVLRSKLRSLNIVARYGRYWDKKVEIDVAAIDSKHGTVYLGECKYWNRPVDAKVLSSLMSKRDSVRAFDGYTVRYCAFSVSGYTDAAIAFADENDFMLFDSGRLLSEPRPGVMHLEPHVRRGP